MKEYLVYIQFMKSGLFSGSAVVVECYPVLAFDVFDAKEKIFAHVKSEIDRLDYTDVHFGLSDIKLLSISSHE